MARNRCRMRRWSSRAGPGSAAARAAGPSRLASQRESRVSGLIVQAGPARPPAVPGWVRMVGCVPVARWPPARRLGSMVAANISAGQTVLCQGRYEPTDTGDELSVGIAIMDRGAPKRAIGDQYNAF